MTVLENVFGLVVGDDDEHDPISASAAEIEAYASFMSSLGSADGDDDEEEIVLDLLSVVVVVFDIVAIFE